jgi:protein TonB
MIIRSLLVVFIAAFPVPGGALGQQRPPWPIIKDFGGATPKNEGTWVTPDDYPSQSLSKGQQGNVVVAFDISAKGRAENCVVEASSGVAAFDRVPCRRIEQRARFQPASDGNGVPKATKARYSVAFWIPN